MTLLDWLLPLVGHVIEREGPADDPFIVWCHEATSLGASPDEVPWCSSLLVRGAMTAGRQHSRSAAARSWATIGEPRRLDEAYPGNDIVVFSRGPNPAAGHVAAFLGRLRDQVWVVGGNQGNALSIAAFPVSRIVDGGVRYLPPR